MSDSDPAPSKTINSIHRLAAGGGVILCVFLLLGGLGHLQGIGPRLEQVLSTPDESAFALVLPALILLATALIDIGVCRALWQGAAWALNLALLCNALTTLYLAYLLAAGVPGHPIGLFLALLASFVLLLGAIRAGLTWPAVVASAG